MAYEEKKYESDKDFEWAIRESDGKEIHITELSAEEKGKKGYRCLGANCGNQLIAVPVRKNPKYKPYFKHAPLNILNGEVKCSFSNAEYREALASSILTRLRRIKVPPIYKVNPENPDEYKLIEESKYIEAFSVQSQVTFFEDEEGNIHWGKKPNIKNRFIIRRPDVVFFNEKGNPVLFIELVITHKLDDDKIADLYRLGIDTIQVKVPISSAEEIEKNFHSIKNIKWVYNEREATTNYVQIPRRDSQRILDPDEFEKRLFKESFRCRVFRISDLIRAIRKSLGSESYGSIEQYLNSEISRVERNTKSVKQRLGELEEHHRAEALGRNRELEEGIIQEQSDLEQNFRKLEKNLIRDIKRAKQKEYEVLNWAAYLMHKSNSKDFSTYKRCLKNPIIAPFMLSYEKLTLSYYNESIYEGQILKESHIYLDSDNIYSIVINVYFSEIRVEKPNSSGFKKVKKKEQIKTILLLKKDNEVETEILWLKGGEPQIINKNELLLF